MTETDTSTGQPWWLTVLQFVLLAGAALVLLSLMAWIIVHDWVRAWRGGV